MIAQGGGFEKGKLVLFVCLNVVFECPDGNPVIGNTRRAAQTASDRLQADWSACSQKSGCPMKLTPSALKQHRTPSDFVARFAGICSAPLKAVFSALRVILILV